MNEKAIKALEFNKILGMLKNKASSALGILEVENIEISKNLEVIKKRLIETKEVVSIIRNYGALPFGAFYDLESHMNIAKIGSFLSIKGVLEVADTIRTGRAVKGTIVRIENSNEKYPVMNTLANNIYSFKYLEDEISRIIISEEEISDHASTELSVIRGAIRKTHGQIRSKLDSIVSNTNTQKYLQEALITVRNDRFVVPVKSNYKNKIPGIVHDRSATGITLYIEPNSIVQLNNKLKELDIDEQQEIERILYEITGKIGEIAIEIMSNQNILRKLDFIIAKSNLAIEMDANIPIINDKGYLNIKNGRHPLIPRNEVVPSNIWLGKEFTSLVITGPNTGGKTVTLKTVGLLTIMTMAGLHIPADTGTEIAIFDEVFADIGDEQSIEQSLSTFSAHMTNIVKILNNVSHNSLVLFDELGAGTDPTEGAALANSILRRLYENEIRTIATTHYNEVKEYALLEDGIENASVEFNVETLSPTYKVSVGIPGRSNAFEISRKLGLMEDVIIDARKFIKRENVQFEEIIAHIEKEKRNAESEHEDAITMRIQIQKMKKELEIEQEKFKKKKSNLLKDAKAEARKILREAKAESKVIINELQDIKKSAKVDNKKIEKLKSNMNNKLNKYNENIFAEVENSEVPDSLNIGDEVKILSLNQDGEVLKIDGKNITVQAGFMKINVEIKNLKKLSESAVKHNKKKKKKEERISEPKKTYAKSVKEILTEIDIRGTNIDEAEKILDEYLDEIYMSNVNTVRIIHGKGTGALREGVRQFLNHNYHVKDYREGGYNEGGSGVTVVTLN